MNDTARPSREVIIIVQLPAELVGTGVGGDVTGGTVGLSVGGLVKGVVVGAGDTFGAPDGDVEGILDVLGAALAVGAWEGAALTDGMGLMVGALVGPLSRSGLSPSK